jgi:putative flippase GtrA
MPTREMMRFAATGIINTIVGLAAIAFGQIVLSLSPYLSNALGYAAGLACSYAFNSRWTFRAGAGSPARLIRFAFAFALAYGANLALLYVLLTAGAPWLLAQTAALLTYSGLFFVLCKFVVFRQPAGHPSAPAPHK